MEGYDESTIVSYLLLAMKDQIGIKCFCQLGVPIFHIEFLFYHRFFLVYLVKKKITSLRSLPVPRCLFMLALLFSEVLTTMGVTFLIPAPPISLSTLPNGFLGR